MAAPNPLLERDDELEVIAHALDRAVEGEGGLILVEGEAGAGKTALLGAAGDLAREREMGVLRARGGEFERDFPYGIVRQLFEPELAVADHRELLSGTAALAAPIFEPSLSATAGDPSAFQHGLYWLLADLAAASPLALLVDDAQWADLASLQALVYCARRLDGLPVLLLATVRSGEAGECAALLEELRREPAARAIVPPPLSAAGAATLIAAGGRPPSPEFAAACCRASGGNPLFLVELLRGLDDIDPSSVDAGSERLADLAAAGVSGSILGRLGQLGENSIAVARAVAVLEPNAEARRIASLTGLESDAVAAACERLIAAQLVFDARPLSFVHPLVRAAVLEGMPTPARAAAHTRAARLLAADGATEDTVAAHLLLAEPEGEEWTVETLRSAAAVALARSAPDAAVRYLRRALAEPPAPGQRLAIGGELGEALLMASDPEGLVVLREVRSRSEDPVARATIAASLANSLGLRVGAKEAAALVEESMEEIGDASGLLGIGLRAEMLRLLVLGLERVPAGFLLEAGEELRPDSFPSRAVMQALGLVLAIGLGPLPQGRDLALTATADRAAVMSDAMAGFPPQGASVALALADRGDLTDDLCGTGIEAARRRGVMLGIPGNTGIRGLCRYLDGELGEAQADAELAVRLFEQVDLEAVRSVHASMAVRTLVARGEMAAAEAMAAHPWRAAEPPAGVPAAMLLCARGELLLAGGRPAEAKQRFLAAAARLKWLPHANPEALPWRIGLSLSEAALGERVAAEAMATEAVEAARRLESERALGIALRALGNVVTDGEQVDVLREAVACLTGTRAALRRAEALVDLGAALRRANHRREAREPLRDGLDLAHRCGATPLAERARTELAATGARPRKAVLSGVESLTPSELRVARMATEGMTNREIAQGLFVTQKTVETHLRHAYQKLDLTGRGELSGALGSGLPI
jgi:DNA-binding CsgD family transcriptional regulator